MQAYVAKTVILSPSFSSPPSLCPITPPWLTPSLPRARAFFLLLPLSTDFLMSAQGNIVACLPTIGYMNMPGPPSDSGGTMICNGAVILTEDRIFMFGANSNKEASASDYITGTTYCTSICCCFPCCYGNRLPKPTSPLSFSLPKPLRHWLLLLLLQHHHHRHDQLTHFLDCFCRVLRVLRCVQGDKIQLQAMCPSRK